MFGTVRFALAQIVVLTHLWPQLLGIWSGTYAVFCFFVVSGYLMARVLDRNYAAAGGTRRFLTNRALRIYPPYLAVLLLAICLVYLVPGEARSLNAKLRLPGTDLGWARNLLIFGLHSSRRGAALIPPAWSVDLELCLYLAIGLVLRRRAGLVAAFTILGAGLTGYALVTDAPFVHRYTTLSAAVLPFGLGALVYHHRPWLDRVLAARWHVAIAPALFAANTVAPAFIDDYGRTLGFYASVLLGAYLVAVLSPLHRGSVPARFARADAMLGALSYPVFLCHWHVGVTVIALGLARGRGADLFLWAVPGAWLLAYLVHVGVERPIASLRDRIRGRTREELA